MGGWVKKKCRLPPLPPPQVFFSGIALSPDSVLEILGKSLKLFFSLFQTIAKRLTESKQTIPHYYLTIDVNLDNISK